MAIHSQLSNIDSRNKLSKQAEQKQNHRYGDDLEGYQLGGEGGKGAVVKNYKLEKEQVQLGRYRIVRGILRMV